MLRTGCNIICAGGNTNDGDDSSYKSSPGTGPTDIYSCGSTVNTFTTSGTRSTIAGFASEWRNIGMDAIPLVDVCLHTLIVTARFSDALKAIEAYPKYAKKRKATYNRREAEYIGACLPLHLALMVDADSMLIMRLIRLYPKATRETDEKGRLPLHLACSLKSPDVIFIIDKLISVYPKAAKVKDNFGRLPLHIASLNRFYSDEYHDVVIQKLLLIYPASARMPDNQGLKYSDLKPGKKDALELLDKDEHSRTSGQRSRVSAHSSKKSLRSYQQKKSSVGRVETASAAPSKASLVLDLPKFEF